MLSRVAVHAVIALSLAFSVKWWLVEPLRTRLLDSIAALMSWLVVRLGIPSVLANGNELHLKNHVLRIDLACTAVELAVVFVALVLVVPVARHRKVQALLVGLPVIFAGNIARLVAVAGVSQWAPEHFRFAHDVLLLGFMTVFVGALWAGWLWVARNDWQPGWSD